MKKTTSVLPNTNLLLVSSPTSIIVGIRPKCQTCVLQMLCQCQYTEGKSKNPIIFTNTIVCLFKERAV